MISLQPFLGHFTFERMSNLSLHIICDDIKNNAYCLETNSYLGLCITLVTYNHRLSAILFTMLFSVSGLLLCCSSFLYINVAIRLVFIYTLKLYSTKHYRNTIDILKQPIKDFLTEIRQSILLLE